MTNWVTEYFILRFYDISEVIIRIDFIFYYFYNVCLNEPGIKQIVIFYINQ